MFYNVAISLGVIIFISPIFKCDERGARVRRIVGGDPAPVPPIDDPVVFIRFAGKTARVEGVRDYPHYVFKGLRYGNPPIKKDRFLRPQQYILNGLENATKYPPPCIQPVPGQNRIIGNEDCLFLNIFTPTLPTGMEGLPVVVWIHGGGYRYGSASQYGVRHLVGRQVVVVTIQYRLGSLGFLSTDTKDLPGNAGLWDMVLAVQFVRNYIGFFGGNPHKIVVMGHNTGASSAIMIALSNVAKGLPISGVVAMSGSSVSHFAKDDLPKNTARDIADQNGCPINSVVTMVRCLQNLSPESIIRGDSYIEFQRLESRGFVSGLGGRLGAIPVTEGISDGRALPSLVEKEPINELYSGSNIKIPLLTGITKDETKRACQGQYRQEIVNNLQTVPNFLDQVLVKSLQSTLGFHKLEKNESGAGSQFSQQLWNTLDPLHFRNYLQVKKNDLNDGIAKISEATGDVLFNVPAFLTVEAWAKRGAPSFLYRFEHAGRRKNGHLFMRGLPLVGNSTHDENVDSDTVGHGDELSYLFEVQDIEGNPLEGSEEMADDDRKVRDIFTQMVSDFARFGKVSLGNKEVKPFSATDNNFIQISPKPKVANNFKFCEMALWCGMAQRLQSSTCQFIKVLDSQLKNVQQQFFDLIPGIGNKQFETTTKPRNENNDRKTGSGFSKAVKPLDVFNLMGNKNSQNSNNNKGKSGFPFPFMH